MIRQWAMTTIGRLKCRPQRLFFLSALALKGFLAYSGACFVFGLINRIGGVLWEKVWSGPMGGIIYI